MAAGEVNWSGNYAYRASGFVQPRSVAEVQELVAGATEAAPVRPLGTRHTFNDLADTPGTLITLGRLPVSIAVDADRRVATVSAASRYGDVAEALEAEGWALANLASLPHISVAGAVATATHGSGSANQNLATAVAGLTFVDGRGELVTLRRGDAGFDGAVVALGALGVTVEVELDIVPSYQVAQTVYTGVPYERIDDALDVAYSVSIFTDWSADAVNQLWVKDRLPAVDGSAVTDRVRELGATPAAHKMHPIAGVDATAATAQFGEPGPWHQRLPHFRLDFRPSAGDEIQSEFLIPRKHTADAVEAIRGIAAESITPILLTGELRAVAADGLWLSTASTSGDDDWVGGALAFHFTWERDQTAAERAATVIERALAPFGARPHWGKVYTDVARIPSLYPRFADFAELVARYDPRGVFRNDYTRRLGL